MKDMMIIGVAGAGAMGRGIAQVAATAGHAVRLYDRDAGVLDEAMAFLRHIQDRSVTKGRIRSEDAAALLGRISTVSTVEDLGPCGLVVEAIVEREEVKKELFASLEAVVTPESVLASNTSSLSITALAAGLQHPDRFIGLHFFNPAPLLPLVEVVPALQTRSGLDEEMSALMRQWGKQPALAKDTPGFIVNRVARPFYGEAIRILEEGVADVATIDWAMTALGGFRMGPFALMDLIGNDVNYAVTESVWTCFSFRPPLHPVFCPKAQRGCGLAGQEIRQGLARLWRGCGSGCTAHG